MAVGIKFFWIKINMATPFEITQIGQFSTFLWTDNQVAAIAELETNESANGNSAFVNLLKRVPIAKQIAGINRIMQRPSRKETRETPILFSGFPQSVQPFMAIKV